MSIKNIKDIKNIKVMIPAAVAVLVIGYLGLSSYASGQAEDRLTAFVSENNLEDTISWKSVSASPFGGTVTVNKVKVENENLLPVELLINKVVIKDFKNDSKDNSANILFSKIQPIDDENEFGQYYHNEIFGMVKAVNEGKEIAPYDLHLNWHYQAKNKSLKLGIKASAPNVVESEFEADLENVADLSSLSQARYLHPAFNMIPDISGGQDRYDHRAEQRFEKTKVKYLAMQFKDQGYLARLNTLEQRYNLPVSPLKGDADKQRKELVKAQYQAMVSECESNFSDVYDGYKKACAALAATWFSTEKGFRIVVDPKQPVSLSALEDLNASEKKAKKVITDLNISVKNL